MNQPKFKFGETVKNNKYHYPKSFIVKRVEWGTVFSFPNTTREGYRYFPDPEKDDYWPEEDLELFQEPKKKLYAYRLRGKTEMKYDIIEDDFLHPQYSRAPDYDIEFSNISLNICNAEELTRVLENL